MSTATHDTTTTRATTKQRIGLVMSGVFCASNAPSAAFPTPAGDVGPPYVVLLTCSVLGVLGFVATALAWRSASRAPLRVLAASMVLITLTSLPAFFVDVPWFVKALVAASLVYVLTALVLVFSDRGAS